MNKQLLENAYEKHQKHYGKTPEEAERPFISTWYDYFIYAPSEEALNAFLKHNQILQKTIPTLLLVVIIPVIYGTIVCIKDAFSGFMNNDITWMIFASLLMPTILIFWNIYQLHKLHKVLKNQIVLIEIKD